jgi:hypothetical protein
MLHSEINFNNHAVPTGISKVGWTQNSALSLAPTKFKNVALQLALTRNIFTRASVLTRNLNFEIFLKIRLFCPVKKNQEISFN